jgi:S-ribosylhomocysteine lyase LuxS involved in autoinducer biosynthesis
VDIGALGERVCAHGGGFFISMDAKKAYQDILDIISNKEEYAQKVKEISQIRIKTTQEMTDEYLDMYRKYIK